MGSEVNLDEAKDIALRAAHALYEALLAMHVPPEIIQTAMTGYASHRAAQKGPASR